MRLLIDHDERDLASMLRGLLAAECPTTVARAMTDPTAQRMPRGLWRALADAGVLGIALPTEYGGSGGGLTDLGIFCVEAGRALCPTVVHSSVLAGLAIHALGGAGARERWLPALAGGTACGTTALWNARDAGAIRPALTACPHPDGGWSLSGAADFVTDADLSDLIVVTASDEAARTLGFVVDLAAQGITVASLDLMGGHRAFCLRFDDVIVADRDALLEGPDGAGLRGNELRRVANTAVALLSLDLVGIGEAVLAATVDHTIMRHQFGRPIASFQAVQHLVADMHIALAAARLAARSAVFWIGQGRTATRETAVARMKSASAAKRITLDAHQLHGGMGYVLETDLHLWSERARVLSTLGGGADIAAEWLQIEIGL
jgi:alkylation response protein AidB-like acyl-CoA dehydrogenase